jgi:hypothetical protein
MPVGGPRKWRSVRNLATVRRQRRKERTWGYCGARRKLAAASSKVSRRAKVAWWKRNLFTKIRTQGDCGSQKELALAHREMTHSAEVAWHRGRTRSQEIQPEQCSTGNSGRTDVGKARNAAMVQGTEA